MASFYGYLDSCNLLIEYGANPLYQNSLENNMYQILVDKDRVELLKAVYDEVDKFDKSRNLDL